MTEIAIKGASGLGDAVYIYPLVEYFSTKYDTVHLMNEYPEVFEVLSNVKCYKHLKINYIPIIEGEHVRKRDIDVRATYGPRKYKPGTSQFEDTNIFARYNSRLRIPDLEFKMPWGIKNKELIKTVHLVANKNTKRKIALIAAPYQPFGREDKWGDEIKIEPCVIQHIIDDLKDMGYLCIAIGNDFCLYEPMVEFNMIGETSVTDLLDLAYTADLCVSQIGNLLPIAEAFGKKNITIFSHNIVNSTLKFLRGIRPEKCVHYKNLNLSIIDDEVGYLGRVYEFCR